jgi:hypothetical protein
MLLNFKEATQPPKALFQPSSVSFRKTEANVGELLSYTKLRLPPKVE